MRVASLHLGAVRVAHCHLLQPMLLKLFQHGWGPGEEALEMGGHALQVDVYLLASEGVALAEVEVLLGGEVAFSYSLAVEALASLALALELE